MVKQFVKTFKVGNCNSKFVVEIVITDDERNNIECYEAWLYNTDYGVKSFMFGVEKNIDLETFESMVMGNIYRYMRGYIDEYMEGGE